MFARQANEKEKISQKHWTILQRLNDCCGVVFFSQKIQNNTLMIVQILTRTHTHARTQRDDEASLIQRRLYCDKYQVKIQNNIINNDENTLTHSDTYIVCIYV